MVLLGRMLMSGFQETVRAELDRDIELVRATQLNESASDSQVGSRLLWEPSSSTMFSVSQSGLAIKNPPKKTT